MEASSSSKVTVEYHDPSGVFPLVSHDIVSRLPLRNLNWQSPSRPLRQIKSLHLELVPDSFTQSTLRPQVQRFDSNGPNSFDIVRSGRDQRRDAVKERRHQIPGLKTSPYLKVYVLRCDDKDAYKDTERKRIREWIRENAQPQGKREDHDAFEWMILHVVIPDTVAASEPRWRESSKDPEELKERNKSTGKLIGKSTRTVFDRLRADFNESSKGSQDRVAQIRIPKGNVSQDLLPTPAVAETIEETPDEREKTWNDLMNKLKTLILGPFDLRVRQYEADIAAQEARRSLPGWNFCTFFIHKEGLAKALESIGLVEDALAIYDELSVGLETVLRDLASGKAEGTATTFASYTDDIKARITGSNIRIVDGTNVDRKHDGHGIQSLDLFGKDYREQIVRSSISVFDFFCYLFTRQTALILRLANTKASQVVFGASSKDGGEDLVLISEVCWRGSSFIHNNARILRQDLASRYASSYSGVLDVAVDSVCRSDSSKAKPSKSDIESLVCSWTYSVAGQLLRDTHAPTLELEAADRRRSLANGAVSKPDVGFGMGANPYPQRTSSLQLRRSAPDLYRPPSTHEDSTFNAFSNSGTELVSKPAGVPGLPELATYRAELVMIQRKMLEQLGGRRGWRVGWASVIQARSSKMEDATLGGEPSAPQVQHDSVQLCEREASAMVSPVLASALKSEAAFQGVYEDLSEQAIRLYLLATQAKSVEAILADLAMLKMQQAYYNDAATYFQNLLPLFSTDGWSLMEAEMLSAYATCLKELDRKSDYMNVSLELLAKVCRKRMLQKCPRLNSPTPFEEDDVNVSGLFTSLVSFSKELTGELTRDMALYFSSAHLEQEIVHLKDKDGFALRLHIEHVLDDEVELDEINARLVAVNDPNQAIWLSSSGKVHLNHGSKVLDLETTVVTFGAYFLDRVILKAGNVRFVQDHQSQATTTPLGIVVTTPMGVSDLEHVLTPHTNEYKRPFVFLYPQEHAFNADFTISRDIHISRPRHLEIAISSGWNDVETIDFKLKPISAGLRLHLSDSVLEGIERLPGHEGKAGPLLLGHLAPHAAATIKVPYTIEQAARRISLRLEAQYNTPKGSFVFLSSFRHATELPLDVDVNDIFHVDRLLSNFTVRTTNGNPLTITSAQLHDSSVHAVEPPPAVYLPATVFDQQPVDLIYKITRKSTQRDSLSKKDAALALCLQFYTMNELTTAVVHNLFADDLRNSPFKALARLLLPVLKERSSQAHSKHDLATAFFFKEFRTPTFDSIGWQETVMTLPRSLQPGLMEWLRNWHDQHARTNIEESAHGNLVRSITISVDVPTVDVVHNASLSLMKGINPHSLPDLPIAALGEAVDAKLRIRHTRAWSKKKLFSSDGENHGTAVDFVYDVQADTEIWLIGGKRRGHFTAREGDELVVKLRLVPLRLGHLALPNVDVQCALPSAGVENKTAAMDTTPMTCETNYESAGREVHVIVDSHTSQACIIEEQSVLSDAIVLPPSRPGTASTKEAG